MGFSISKYLREKADPADVFGGKAAAAGIESSERIGQQTLGMQQEWMDWIKETFGPYSDVAEQAIGQQQELAGLGGEDARQQIIGDIQSDPLYQAKVKAGDEAVLRNVSATGGLRSGTAQEALAAQNQALLGSEIENRYQKLAGLSGQGFQGQQAQGTFGSESIGQMSGTLGNIASGQIAQSAAASNRGSGLASGIMGMFSDERLKANIVPTGKRHGLTWYEWDWNATAEKAFNLTGSSEGHMAGEVEKLYPEFVGESNGYKTVNYEGLTNGRI